MLKRLLSISFFVLLIATISAVLAAAFYKLVILFRIEQEKSRKRQLAAAPQLFEFEDEMSPEEKKRFRAAKKVNTAKKIR